MEEKLREIIDTRFNHVYCTNCIHWNKLLNCIENFLGVKSNKIRKENYNLKPLDLKKSGINATLFDELRKCDEENAEFTQAIIKCDYDNAIEEFWDSVQTKLNVMDMAGIKLEDVYKGLDKHKEKMESRGNIFKK